VRHIHHLGLDHDSRAVGQVAADDDRVCVHGLGQFERTGPRGMKALRQAEVVKLRYLVGMTFPQTAEVLGISSEAARHLSRHARAWLYREMAKTRA